MSSIKDKIEKYDSYLRREKAKQAQEAYSEKQKQLLKQKKREYAQLRTKKLRAKLEKGAKVVRRGAERLAEAQENANKRHSKRGGSFIDDLWRY